MQLSDTKGILDQAWLGKVIQLELCKRLKSKIHTNHLIQARRPDLFLIVNKGFCFLIQFSQSFLSVLFLFLHFLSALFYILGKYQYYRYPICDWTLNSGTFEIVLKALEAFEIVLKAHMQRKHIDTYELILEKNFEIVLKALEASEIVLKALEALKAHMAKKTYWHFQTHTGENSLRLSWKPWKPLRLSWKHWKPLRLSWKPWKPLRLSWKHWKPLRLSWKHWKPLRLSWKH